MPEIHKYNSTKFERLISENAAKIKNSEYGQKYYKQHFNNPDYINSLAISVTVLMEYYKVDSDVAIQSLTDGPNDNKIDLLYFDEETIETDPTFDTKFMDLIIIQAKHAQKPNSVGHITQNEVNSCIETANKILSEDIDTSNQSLLSQKLYELKQLIQQNNYPSLRIHVYFATNGVIGDTIKTNTITLDGIDSRFIDATNFGNIVTTPCTATLKVLSNKNLTNTSADQIEGFVTETTLEHLADFYQQYNEKALLSSNVRYLLSKSQVNKSIKGTAITFPNHFWFFNNGVSIIAEKCSIEATGTEIFNLNMIHPSIINGGQTVALASQLLKEDPAQRENLKMAKVLIRAYTTMDDVLALQIAQATNSQNPINVVNLKSNNPYQKKVAEYFSSQGVALIVKPGSDLTDYTDNITNESLLQLYASLYENDPAKAKLSKSAIFNMYFDKVFNEEQENNNVEKKLYRCYQLWVLLKKSNINVPWFKHGVYAFLYTIKNICPNLLNEDICEKETEKNFSDNISATISIIENIIKQKTDMLKERFSYNNLFKGSEIKDLIDLETQKQTD